jgi:phosphoribosylaminoimidazole-succinocarboxamide synthase
MYGTLLESKLSNLKLFKRGKTRDIYDLGDSLLIVATDRISAFDIVLPTGISHKGRVLTSLSLFWFSFTRNIVPNHVLPWKTIPSLNSDERLSIQERAMIVRKANPFPVECIVRGYLSGSAWKEYVRSGLVSGITLPSGLNESDRLDAPIFTPSTKAESGHDQNIGYIEFEALVGANTSKRLKDISIEVYSRASQYAEKKGVIIADTKLEFGICEGELILIDELLTPDSSRFWPNNSYMPGRSQPSFDKQFVRDYLEGIHWNKEPPAPELPIEVVRQTSSKYMEAVRRLEIPETFQF